MPPRAKITKDMIIHAAFSIVREKGADKITARSISEQLGCSTQPVLYYFSTVDDIKKAAYEEADKYHSEFILNTENTYQNPMLAIGMNYIRFATEEANLFRFLFQTNEFAGANLLDLTNAQELAPIMNVLQQELHVSENEANEIFRTLFIFVHGYASLFANNALIYDETQIINDLTKVFNNTVCTVRGENHE
ncbi:MAG: TetR/AcrR family transcriptional regulator [Clostridium sp.]|nr:TetR/AcrR family transcriptional regulator [Clostridium sp.]